MRYLNIVKSWAGTFLALAIALAGVAPAQAAGNVTTQAPFHYAWSDTAGWINFMPTGGGVTVLGTCLAGAAWGENIGWIQFGADGVCNADGDAYLNEGPADWGVNRNGSQLSGYAWSDTAGWVNFAPTGGGVTIDASGYFQGAAWGENLGWIQFSGGDQYGVRLAEVIPGNTPPAISGTPAATAAVDHLYSFTPAASDPDGGDILGFTIENAPPGSTFDPLSGRLEWTPGEDHTGLSFDNILISVSDGVNPAQSLPPFSIVVRAFPDPAQSLYSATFAGMAVVDEDSRRGDQRDAAPGDEIAVFDGDGVLCGHTVLDAVGQYVLTVYGDDPATGGIDEGAIEGESLTAWIWDDRRGDYLPLRVLNPDGTRGSLVFQDAGGGSPTLHGKAQFSLGLYQTDSPDGAAYWFLDANDNGRQDLPADSIDHYLGSFGTPTMVPVVGDWNGDGFMEYGAFDNGSWYLDANASGTWEGEAGGDLLRVFGTGSMLPLVGDWNDDGVSDIGAFENGTTYIDQNANGTWDGEAGGDLLVRFGAAGMIPVPGDWNDDGLLEAAAYDQGTWYVDTNGNGQWDGTAGGDEIHQFGSAAMTPVAGDWDGDGLLEMGAWENGTWYLDLDGNGQWDGTDLVVPGYGGPGDRPLSGLWH